MKDNNTGIDNSGYLNSGHGNSGDYNSGDWNPGDYNSGAFNRDCSKMRLDVKIVDNTLDEIERLTGIVGIKLPKTANKLEKLIQALITEAEQRGYGKAWGKYELWHKKDTDRRIAEANKAGYRKGYEHCLVGKKPTEQLKEKL